jgi:hypothetical protein
MPTTIRTTPESSAVSDVPVRHGAPEDEKNDVANQEEVHDFTTGTSSQEIKDVANVKDVVNKEEVEDVTNQKVKQVANQKVIDVTNQERNDDDANQEGKDVAAKKDEKQPLIPTLAKKATVATEHATVGEQ